MKLSQIYTEQKKLREIYGSDLKRFKKSLKFMPAAKQKHSFRVANMAAKAGLGREHVDAAILHDYIERGGDVAQLPKLGLSNHALHVIKILSLEEKTPGADDTAVVLDHIRSMLNDPEIDERTKNIAIVIKASDRLDNLRRRIRSGKLVEKYWGASVKLLKMLFDNYGGDHESIKYLKNKFNKVSSTVAAHGFDAKIPNYK